MTKKREYFSALLIVFIVGTGLVTFSGSVFSGYHFMDCSDFTRIQQTVRETSWWQSLVSFFLSDSGRFRPGWCLYMHIVSCMPWGDNMLAQGIVKILLNIIVAFILYVTARNITWTHWEGLLFSGLTMIGTQSAIFYQTVSQETTGLLFWTLSLYCLTKYIIIINKINSWYYAGFMITSLAAILSKESFILVLPASYIFYCLLYKEKYKTGFLTTSLHTWKTGLFLCLLTIAGLIAVLIFANDRATDTHCGLKPYIKALLYCYGISGGVVPALAGTFYLWRMKTNINNWLYPLLLFLLITVPQIILYAPSGIVDRYLMPAMTGCAFFAIYVYRKLKIEDSILNGKFWKNIGIGLGVAAIMGCSLIVFDNSIQQKIVNFAFRIQGEEWQNMTAVSSLQYLLNTVSTIAITGILTGIILVSWGCRRKNHSILKISQLYVGVLCLILILECGLAFASCRRYAMRGYATEGFLHTVIDNSTPGDLILVTGCPTIETEGLTKGFVTYMHKYDRKNLFIYPLARGPKEELAATDMIRFYNNKTIDEISNKHDIRIIAIFSGQEELFKKRAIWFDMKQYSRYEFAGNYVVYTKDEF